MDIGLGMTNLTIQKWSTISYRSRQVLQNSYKKKKKTTLNISDIDEIQQGRQWELHQSYKMNAIILQERRKTATMTGGQQIFHNNLTNAW